MEQVTEGRIFDKRHERDNKIEGHFIGTTMNDRTLGMLEREFPNDEIRTEDASDDVTYIPGVANVIRVIIDPHARVILSVIRG